MASKRRVMVGSLPLGGGAPILVQTMADERIKDVSSVLSRLCRLKALGCDIVRFAFDRADEAPLFAKINERSPLPLVADIHFDSSLAMLAIDAGFSKIRINPGDIGNREKTLDIARKARDLKRAIRVGINAASLPRRVKAEPVEMAKLASDYVSLIESTGLEDIVVSIKSSDIKKTIESNIELQKICPYPIHLGLTEAGGVTTSLVRSTLALVPLLMRGIGDTIRYSITGEVEGEAKAGDELLRSLGKRERGVRIISCPMCARHTFDVKAFLSGVEEDLLSLDLTRSVAIMGCPVNGPGEARGVDVAITGLNDKTYLYKKGRLVRAISPSEARSALLEALNEG